ncbi:hypothetical protein CC1G_08679 [Coprinopsis cinerea okayama7|uniref:Uncharacterized protein n=1 Tax=Coprinopsis cinerea (strain Okayama-7 / 130 / ATCC MYA-4618 / FGSC 9003) TaxID=240176 RepID=A8NZF4_COPC7|nr:hypothetical protein CC1G_08679 [Coprinopsis cinerea okayama7\|eukprot:XP_001837666.1 hypothetical protein CC1G_08679 [Coprinopsis cinerea okayama7\
MSPQLNVSGHPLARLNRELTELLEEPSPGVTVFIDDVDDVEIRRFCLVLTPQAGPLTGLNLHFDVYLYSHWELLIGYSQPSSSPRLHWSRDYLRHHGYSGVYTDALTLRGLIQRLLALLSCTSTTERNYGGRPVWLGDHIVTTYVEDKYISLSNPWELCCHAKNRERCNCRLASGGTQATLKARYEANPGEETVVRTIRISKGDIVTHKAKKGIPRSEQVHKLEMLNRRYISTLKNISTWTCSKCPYGSDALPHVQRKTAQKRKVDPTVSLVAGLPTSRFILDEVNDDVLLEIAANLTRESVIAFGQAYPRFHALANAHCILLKRDMHCSFLKTQLNESILGISVTFNPQKRILSSDFEWVSMEAYDKYEATKSVQSSGMPQTSKLKEFFLPLAFRPSHFDRAKEETLTRLLQIASTVREAENRLVRRNDHGPARGRGRGRGGHATNTSRPRIVPTPKGPADAVRVVYKMMNNIVTELVASRDEAFKTESTDDNFGKLQMTAGRAIVYYCHLMHLLISMAGDKPIILNDAVARLQRFLASPDNRTKDSEPDMGELIAVVAFVLIMSPPGESNSPTWSMMNGPILEEVIIRNVRWVLRDSPELEILEHSGASPYRLDATFARSKTSLRLMMFQVTFLDLFVRTYRAIGIQALDQNYGFAVKELPDLMAAEIKDIYEVSNWPGFFKKVQYERAQRADFTKERFTAMLREAVRKSEARGYHVPTTGADRRKLVRIRATKDPNF